MEGEEKLIEDEKRMGDENGEKLRHRHNDKSQARSKKPQRNIYI